MILWVFMEFFGVKIAIELSKNHCDLILTVGFNFGSNMTVGFNFGPNLTVGSSYICWKLI